MAQSGVEVAKAEIVFVQNKVGALLSEKLDLLAEIKSLTEQRCTAEKQRLSEKVDFLAEIKQLSEQLHQTAEGQRQTSDDLAKSEQSKRIREEELRLSLEEEQLKRARLTS